jgi:hypothetical protein
MSVPELLTAIPTKASGNNPDSDLLRAELVDGGFVIPDDTAVTGGVLQIDPRDAALGAVRGFYIFGDGVFKFDPDDESTAHDGISTLVLIGGKRYKVLGDIRVKAVEVVGITVEPTPTAYGQAWIDLTGVVGDANDIIVHTSRGWVEVAPDFGPPIYVKGATAGYPAKSYVHWDADDGWVAGVGAGSYQAATINADALIGGGGTQHHIVENQTTNDPPGTVTDGVKYIIGSVPTGAWAGQSGKIAAGENGAWVILTPAEGWIAYDKALNIGLRFTGTAWESSLGAWVAIATPQVTINGNHTANGSNSVYIYSDTGAPTTSHRAVIDDSTITHAAKRANAWLRLDYAGDVTLVNGPNLGFGTTRALTIAVFRDDEANAIAYRSLPQVGAAAGLMSFSDFFMVQAPDAAEHEYKMAVMSGTSATGTTFDATAIYRRMFTLQEAA